TLRVASFNIHGCRDANGDFDVDRTARALEGFDLIGLNEVHGAWEWQGPDQAEVLGERLKLPWLFLPPTYLWGRYDFGIGLLCRVPVTHWQRVPLPGTREKGHRNMLSADVNFAGQTLHLIVTHIDTVQDRSSQLEHVFGVFLKLPEP